MFSKTKKKSPINVLNIIRLSMFETQNPTEMSMEYSNTNDHDISVDVIPATTIIDTELVTERK